MRAISPPIHGLLIGHLSHNILPTMTNTHTHIYIHRLTRCIVYAHIKIGANCWNFNKNNSGIPDVGQRSCANGLRVRFKLAASGMKIARPRQMQKLYGCLTGCISGSHIAYSYNDSRLNWDKRSLGSPSGPEFPTVAPASSLMSFSWHSFGSGHSCSQQELQQSMEMKYFLITCNFN